MSSLVVFDFDNTLAHITDFHKLAWRYTLHDVGLEVNLAKYLPTAPFLMERFDSSNRVRQNFFQSPVDRSALEFFFGTQNSETMTTFLLDLKESHLLHLLGQVSPSAMAGMYARNIFPGIDTLLSQGHRLGIVSSTRESVILKALSVSKLDDAFTFIIGEESMYGEQGVLYDKPLAFAKTKIPARLLHKATEVYYVGDDVHIDSAFARNCAFRYIQFVKESNFINLCKLIGQP